MYSLLTSWLPDNYAKILQDCSDRVAITITQAHIKSQIELTRNNACVLMPPTLSKSAKVNSYMLKYNLQRDFSVYFNMQENIVQQFQTVHAL